MSAVILSDFDCLDAENSAEESKQASSNEKFTNESSEDKDQLTRLTSSVNMELEEVEMIQGKLVAATAYCDKLKPESSLIGE